MEGLYLGFLLFSVSTFCGFGKCHDDTTLTTTALREHTSPIPSTIHRRINIGVNIEDSSNSPLDIFLKWKDNVTKKSRSVWDWDYYCQMQPKTGNCSVNMQRYYYDVQLDQCSTFTFSGCNGNKNNFETLIECERYCKGANYWGLKQTKMPVYCHLQPDSGMCFAYLTRYYYHLSEKRCKTFLYGGCGGNQNRFFTRIKCEHHCQNIDNKDNQLDSEYIDFVVNES